MGFGDGRGEFEADQPVGGDGVAVDLGRGEIPAVRGLQGLVSKILARAGGKDFRGGDVAGRIDVELDGYADGAVDGGARPRRDVGHDLIEHFALSDGARGGPSGGFDARRIGDASESGGSWRGSRRARRARIISVLRRGLKWSLRCVLRGW